MLETVVTGVLSSCLLLWLRVIPRDHMPHPCCYEGPIARERPIRERKKVYERRKRLYILRMVACLSRISMAELII